MAGFKLAKGLVKGQVKDWAKDLVKDRVKGQAYRRHIYGLPGPGHGFSQRLGKTQEEW